MSKIVLNNVASLLDATTAAITINTNSATVQNAFDNTLSRDGTNPNQMNATIDMNSNHIINLPAPVSANDPVRFQDLNTLQAGGTVATLPTGGTTGQSLQKNSNTNFDVGWGNNVSSVGLSLPADFTVTNSPVTSTGTLTGTFANAPTGTGGFVRSTSPTITTPTISSIVNTGTLTLPVSTDTLTGRNTVDTLTNKTFDTAGAGNVFKVNGTQITAKTGTGSVVLATSPTLVTPTLGAATATTVAFSPTTGGIIGTATNDNANAGNVGEFVSSTVQAASPVSLSSGVTANLTSMSLTAGDWDVSCQMYFVPTSTTSVQLGVNSISTTSATLDTAPGNFGEQCYVTTGTVIGANNFNVNAGPRRMSLTTTTTVFATALAVFSASTLGVFGILRARRIR